MGSPARNDRSDHKSDRPHCKVRKYIESGWVVSRGFPNCDVRICLEKEVSTRTREDMGLRVRALTPQAEVKASSRGFVVSWTV